jgi:hypothetical protein
MLGFNIAKPACSAGAVLAFLFVNDYSTESILMSKKLSSTAVALLGAAAISGLLAGTASASSDLASSKLLLKTSARVRTAVADNARGAAADAAATDKHDCKGHNSCKGKGGCKSGDNNCKGKNSCKGKGGCNTMGTAPTATPAGH